MINIWKSARELMRNIYLATYESKFLIDSELSEILRNSSISIMYYIGESYQKLDSRERLFLFSMAKESHDCLRTNLNIAHEKSYIGASEMSFLLKELGEVIRMINECIKHLSNQPNENSSSFYHEGLNINKEGSACLGKSIQ